MLELTAPIIFRRLWLLLKCTCLMFHYLSFFLSWVAKTQLHHCTKWVVSTQFITQDRIDCPGPFPDQSQCGSVALSLSLRASSACVAVCCNMLQCVAGCCSVLQRVSVKVPPQSIPCITCLSMCHNVCVCVFVDAHYSPLAYTHTTHTHIHTHTPFLFPVCTRARSTPVQS